MKQKFKLLILGAILSLILLGGGLFLYLQTRYKISSQEAQVIAMKNAGVTKEMVNLVRTKKDFDDGYATYDVKLYAGDKQYDYVIDAGTGQILEVEADVLAPTSAPAASSAPAVASTPATQAQATPESSSSDSAAPAASAADLPASETVQLSQEEAKAIALKDAALEEAAVTGLTIQVDIENGVTVYDVDFVNAAAGLDYDYQINAQTGDILQKSQEPHN